MPSVTRPRPLDPALDAKLSELAALPGDWDGYGAKAPNLKSVALMRDTMAVLPEDVTVRRLVPIADGGIAALVRWGQTIADVVATNRGRIEWTWCSARQPIRTVTGATMPAEWYAVARQEPAHA